MKRLWLILACVLLVAALATPALAENMEVIFTPDSVFDVGGTVTVDKGRTLDNITNNGMSEHYNAYLEGNVQYFWYRDGVWDESFGNAESVTFNESHRGCTFYCQAVLYGDMDRTMQVGAVNSMSFTIGSVPEITTRSIPDGVVGRAYYVKLECTDGDATFQLLRSSLPNGMTLTQHGEIEGTPTQSGFFHINVLVTDPYGIENTASFEFTIHENAPAETQPAPAETRPVTPVKPVSGPEGGLPAPSVQPTAPDAHTPEASTQPATDNSEPAGDAQTGSQPELLTVILIAVLVFLTILLIGAVLVIGILILRRQR